MHTNQRGFAHLLLLVLLIAVAVVGFAAYRVRTANNTPAAPTASSNSNTLTSSSTELDQADSQLDASLDDTALNSDLDSM
jgi:Tfp pilus assembly protein PilV